MLTITAYSDIPVDIFLNEPEPFIYEDEDGGENSGFAEILAGLLSAPSQETPRSVPDKIAAEKAEEGNRLNIFSNELEKAQISLADIDVSEIDPKVSMLTGQDDAVLDDDFQNIINTDQIIYGEEDLTYGTNFFTMEPAGEPGIQDLNDLQLPEYVLKESFSSDTAPASDKKPPADSAFIAEKIKTEPAANLNAVSDAAVKQNADEAAALKKNSAGRDSQAENVSFKNLKTEDASGARERQNQPSDFFDKRGDTPGKLDEHRSRVKKDKLSFDVHDLRNGTNIKNLEHRQALAENARAPAQVSLELRLGDSPQAQQQAAQRTEGGWETRSSAALENMLARELHQSFNSDIVRHASMILRNGGEGIIRLTLHPQTLGNVKIHLEMAENKITGHIYVESEESMNAFRREIAALEQAFKDSGFAGANLDLSLTGGGADKPETGDQSFAAKNAASRYEDSYGVDTPGSVVDVFFGRKTGSVNMLA